MYITELTNLDPWDFSSMKIKAALPVRKIAEGEKWRLVLLDTLLDIRRTKSTCVEDTKRITAMLHSLCNT